MDELLEDCISWFFAGVFAILLFAAFCFLYYIMIPEGGLGFEEQRKHDRQMMEMGHALEVSGWND